MPILPKKLALSVALLPLLLTAEQIAAHPLLKGDVCLGNVC